MHYQPNLWVTLARTIPGDYSHPWPSQVIMLTLSVNVVITSQVDLSWAVWHCCGGNIDLA
jgi:hypothetical protein